jgi:anti-sigma factor RsiW
VSELDKSMKFETEFEARLAEEMAQVPAPEGFADRVMGRVAAQRAEAAKPARVLAFRGGLIARSRIAMAVAAALLIAVATGAGLRVEQRLKQQAEEQRQEQAKAALAERQFALAMQVTSRTLVEVQERIGRAGAKDRDQETASRE